MEAKLLSYMGFLENKPPQLKTEGTVGKKSTILIWFFMRAAVLAATYPPAGFFTESGESLFTSTTTDGEPAGVYSWAM